MEKTHFTIISEACCTVSLIDSAMIGLLRISAIQLVQCLLNGYFYESADIALSYFTKSVASISKNTSELLCNMYADSETSQSEDRYWSPVACAAGLFCSGNCR